MAFEQPVSRRTFMAVTVAAAAATVLQGRGVQGAPGATRRYALGRPRPAP